MADRDARLLASGTGQVGVAVDGGGDGRRPVEIRDGSGNRVDANAVVGEDEGNGRRNRTRRKRDVVRLVGDDLQSSLAVDGNRGKRNCFID